MAVNNVRFKPSVMPGLVVALIFFGIAFAFAIFMLVDDRQWRAKLIDNYAEETCKIAHLEKYESKYSNYYWDLNCPSVPQTRHGEISHDTYLGSFVGQEIQVFFSRSHPEIWQLRRPTPKWKDESNSNQLWLTLAIFGGIGGGILACWLNAKSQVKFLSEAVIIEADVVDITPTGDKTGSFSLRIQYELNGDSIDRTCTTMPRNLSNIYKSRKILVAVCSRDHAKMKIIDQMNYVELFGPPNLHPNSSS